VCIILIHLLRDMKNLMVMLCVEWQSAVNIRTPNISACKGTFHQLDPTSYGFTKIINPLSPLLGCHSIPKTAISAVFLSPSRVGLELFRKSEYVATSFMYLFALNIFCFGYAAK